MPVVEPIQCLEGGIAKKYSGKFSTRLHWKPQYWVIPSTIVEPGQNLMDLRIITIDAKSRTFEVPGSWWSLNDFHKFSYVCWALVKAGVSLIRPANGKIERNFLCWGNRWHIHNEQNPCKAWNVIRSFISNNDIFQPPLKIELLWVIR